MPADKNGSANGLDISPGRVRRQMSRKFACSCTDESRAEAEGWLQEVVPELESEEDHGKIDLTETLLLALEEWAQELHGSVSVSVVSDQWCGVNVTFEPWDCGKTGRGSSKYHNDHEPRNSSYAWVQYDYGFLPHALAAAYLALREGRAESD